MFYVKKAYCSTIVVKGDIKITLSQLFFKIDKITVLCSKETYIRLIFLDATIVNI